MCSFSYGWKRAVGYVVNVQSAMWWVAHVIIVSPPVPIGLWIFDCFGFGIGSRGNGLGTRGDTIITWATHHIADCTFTT